MKNVMQKVNNSKIANRIKGISNREAGASVVELIALALAVVVLVSALTPLFRTESIKVVNALFAKLLVFLGS